MDDRVLRLRVGVVVLAAALITAFLVARFGDLPLPGGGVYTVFVRFPRAPGITPGSPVRMSGVQIGRVTRLDLLQPSGVRVAAEIDRGRTILDCDVCWISSASVLGDSVLEFVPPDRIPTGAKTIEAGTEIINGSVAANPMESFTKIEPALQSAMRSVSEAGNEVTIAARHLNNTITNNQDQFPRIAQKTERALDRFTEAITNINSLVDDPQARQEMKQSFRDFPRAVRDFSNTLQRADAAFDSLKNAGDRATTNLANLENFTKPLGERGPQLVDNLDGSLANINELLEQLVTFTDNLNNREGTLGRLLNDDELYGRLERTLANVEAITAGVKPIVGDIRILSDKLSRDPSQILKLRSLLDRRPPGAGTKGTPTTRDAHWGYEEAPIVVDPNGSGVVWVP